MRTITAKLLNDGNPETDIPVKIHFIPLAPPQPALLDVETNTDVNGEVTFDLNEGYSYEITGS